MISPNGFTKAILAALVFAMLAGCMQRGGGFRTFDGGTGGGGGGGGFTPIGGGGSGSGGGTNPIGSGNNNGGTGPNGSLTNTDKQALNNLFADTAKSGIQPQNPGAAKVSQAVQAEIERLLQLQRQGQQVSVQLMQIAGQMLQECSANAGILAPIPGQPLLGSWASAENAECRVQFTISGAPALSQQTTNKYGVSGEVEGIMVADQNGVGVIQGNPWSGNIRDTPQAGNGTLRHPTFFPATGGKNPQPARPCDSPVLLVNSANPIPANYDEAMARLGCCFRQAVMLMSPTMVQLITQMDPRLAGLLIANSGCGTEEE